MVHSAVDIGVHRLGSKLRATTLNYDAVKLIYGALILRGSLQKVEHHAALLLRLALHNLQHRERYLLLAEVVVRGLARVVVALEVEDVVLNLKRHTDSLAKLTHTLHLFALSAHRQGAEGSTHTKKTCRLLVDDFEVVIACGIHRLGVLTLQHLALAERSHCRADI